MPIQNHSVVNVYEMHKVEFDADDEAREQVRFSDGNWLTPENLALWHPMHVHRVDVRNDQATILAPSTQSRTRGAQLNTLAFTLTLFSPAEGIIGVRIEHFRGGRERGPHFEIRAESGFSPTVEDTDEALTVTSGQLTARIQKMGDWRLDFYRNGERLTGSGLKSAGYASERQGGKAWLFERLDMAIGEQVYGLGERFGPFAKNGQHVEIWNRDGGASSDQAYKNVPFLLTNRGWGLFVNHPGKVDFEIATEKASKLQFSVEDERLEYFVIDGPEPKDVLNRYTGLTGRPSLPAPWSFGLWLTTSFTTDYDETTVNGFIDGMAERDIPLHVFHFDCFWMRGFNWCDFEWDPEVFPNPPDMLARLKAKGLKICVWINPYIAQQSPLFDEGKAKGYFLRRPDGSVWQWDLWQAGQAIVDFTNPDACAWFKAHLRRLVRMGVDSFKTDFGERIPVDVVYHDGSDPERMHNYYSYLYNRVVVDLLEEELGQGQAVVFARSGTTGSQTMPVHWGGDCYSDFASMAETLRGGLSLGLSGFGFWSHDIGGFESTSPASVYKRWCAFGLLSSHSRLHGSGSYRVPWLYDEEAVDVLRRFTRLKCRLMPYLFAMAAEAGRTGAPLLRAMILEFPNDPTSAFLDRQYMLGDGLLVAPVLSEDGIVEWYLPAGQWTHLLDGHVIEGGRWLRERFDYMSVPLYVRPNSLLATGAIEDLTDYDFARGATFTLYQLGDGETAEATVCAADGAPTLRVLVRRHGETLNVEAFGEATDWSLVLNGMHEAAMMSDGVTMTDTPGGMRIEGQSVFSVRLGR